MYVPNCSGPQKQTILEAFVHTPSTAFSNAAGKSKKKAPKKKAEPARPKFTGRSTGGAILIGMTVVSLGVLVYMFVKHRHRAA